MKTRLILCLASLLAIVGCDKDNFETTPKLTVKSVTPNPVPINALLRITLEFTDQEGDVSDSLIIVRQRLNVRGPLSFVSKFIIPDFPAAKKGEFLVNIPYQTELIAGIQPLRIPGSNPAQYENDTMRLKIVARDNAGNKSDTTLVDLLVQRTQ